MQSSLWVTLQYNVFCLNYVHCQLPGSRFVSALHIVYILHLCIIYCPPTILFVMTSPFCLQRAGEEDATFITWQVVNKGAAHRCECGQFYQLVDANPTKIDNI